MLDKPSQQLVTETKSVPNSNTVSEAKLDHLLREKPNATTIVLEGLVLFSNNKTTQWLNEKSPEDREAIFKRARKIAPEFKDLYKQRRKKLLEDRAKALRDKQLALQKLWEKSFERRQTNRGNYAVRLMAE